MEAKVTFFLSNIITQHLISATKKPGFDVTFQVNNLKSDRGPFVPL